MSQTAEFEEKTYEKYFGHELVRGKLASFSPGQHAENVLGFDEAFYVPWHIQIRCFRYLMQRPWLNPKGVDRKYFDRFAGELSAHLPHFRLNLFIQFKRPEYLSGHRAAERQHWNAPYYRYLITKQQQSALERLHSLSAGRAAIVYASPTFWTREDLFRHASSRSVIAHSNVAPVHKLSGHGRYTYVAPGGSGKAHSDPVSIEGPSFEGMVSDLMRQDGLPFDQHIKLVSEQIRESVSRDDASSAVFEMSRRAILAQNDSIFDDDSPASFLHALVNIEAFSDAFDVAFHAIG